MDWLWQFFAELHWQQVAWAVGLFLATFVGSLVMVSFLLVNIPATFFLESHDRGFWIDRHPLLRIGALVLKNLLGAGLVIMGIILSLPGVPGQGLLTILIGLILLDIPGKRKLERKLIGRPAVQRFVNSLRARYKKPPILLHEDTQRAPGAGPAEERPGKPAGE